MKYYVYILESQKDGRFYIGQSSNIKDRIERHNQNRSRATKFRGPWKIVYCEKFDSRNSAIIKEKYLKSLKNRKYLQDIINRCGVEE